MGRSTEVYAAAAAATDATCRARYRRDVQEHCCNTTRAHEVVYGDGGFLHIAVVGPSETRGSETRVPLQMREDQALYDTDEGIGFTRRFSG